MGQIIYMAELRVLIKKYGNVKPKLEKITVVQLFPTHLIKMRKDILVL